jgi:hypothetical protein
MTARKSDIRLTSRLTTYLTRVEVAGELRLSPATIGEMVDDGPPPKSCLFGPATRRDRDPSGERPDPGGLAGQVLAAGSKRRERFEDR